MAAFLLGFICAFFLQFFIILFTLFFSGFSFAGISCAQKATTGVGNHPGFSCNAWQGSGWAEIGRDVSPTDPDVFSATCGRVSSCTCPTGSDLTSHTDESGAAYADCATNSGEGDGQGDTQTSSSVPACDGDPNTIEICQGSDNSSSDSGQNSSEPSSSGGSGSSSGSGSDSSSGSGSGSSAGSGDNGSGDIPDNSSSGNPGSGGDSGSGQGGGGGGSGGSGTGGAEYDECLILHDPAFCDSAFSSSSSGQDCLPGYHYYPNTFTCVPDSSSSSSSSFSSGSSSSNSSKASSAGSSSSFNSGSSSSFGGGGGGGGGASNSSASGDCDPTAKDYLSCLTQGTHSVSRSDRGSFDPSISQKALQDAEAEYQQVLDGIKSDISQQFGSSNFVGQGTLQDFCYTIFGQEVCFGLAKFSGYLNYIGQAIFLIGCVLSFFIIARR